MLPKSKASNIGREQTGYDDLAQTKRICPMEVHHLKIQLDDSGDTRNTLQNSELFYEYAVTYLAIECIIFFAHTRVIPLGMSYSKFFRTDVNCL